MRRTTATTAAAAPISATTLIGRPLPIVPRPSRPNPPMETSGSAKGALEVGGIEGGEALPLRRDLLLRVDRVDRASLDARVAVDALVGIDVELLVRVVVGLLGGRMDAIHRADLHTRVVLLADARLRDHVGHSHLRR